MTSHTFRLFSVATSFINEPREYISGIEIPSKPHGAEKALSFDQDFLALMTRASGLTYLSLYSATLSQKKMKLFFVFLSNSDHVGRGKRDFLLHYILKRRSLKTDKGKSVLITSQSRFIMRQQIIT